MNSRTLRFPTLTAFIGLMTSLGAWFLFHAASPSLLLVPVGAAMLLVCFVLAFPALSPFEQWHWSLAFLGPVQYMSLVVLLVTYITSATRPLEMAPNIQMQQRFWTHPDVFIPVFAAQIVIQMIAFQRRAKP